MIARIEVLVPDWSAVDKRVIELLRPAIDYSTDRSAGTARALFVTELRERGYWPPSARSVDQR